MEWISVKEELPEDTDEVLITDGNINGQTCAVGWYRKSDQTWHVETDSIEVRGDAYVVLDLNVKYWMELPKPPQQHK
jgi:hypothetical protein